MDYGEQDANRESEKRNPKSLPRVRAEDKHIGVYGKEPRGSDEEEHRSTPSGDEEEQQGKECAIATCEEKHKSKCNVSAACSLFYLY